MTENMCKKLSMLSVKEYVMSKIIDGIANVIKKLKKIKKYYLGDSSVT